MTALEALRNAHERLIDQDPISISLRRNERIDDGAGGKIKGQPINLPPFQGRLVQKRNQPYFNISESGSFQTNDWLLLAPWDCDIQRGDSFTVDGQTFRVVRVYVRKFGGDIFAIQADVEEVI